jgi:hypothetical protein
MSDEMFCGLILYPTARHCAPGICATRLARRSLRAQRSNLVEIASSPSAPRNDAPETDVLAAAIGADPVAFRLRYLTAPRDIAVVKAAAERANWERRRSRGPLTQSG